MDCGSTILIFIAFIQATCGQSVTLEGPSAVEQGSVTVYTCSGSESPYVFTWTDISVVPNVNIFTAGGVTYPSGDTKYVNFGVSENEGTSTMTITNTVIEDEGQYRCAEGQERDEANLTVEVQSARNVLPESPIKSNINDTFEATCEAVGGRPVETITWLLGDGTSPCDDPDETYPAAGEGLFSTTSVCTFQATSENNNGQTLKCVISGHQVSGLNGEVTATLDTHRLPATDITVGFQFLDPTLRVSCDIADPTQPNPSIRNYYIYSNGTLIHQSSMGINFVDVPGSGFDLNSNFTCVGGNYLGNITSQPTPYDPTSTTTPTPTTATEGTSPVVDSGGPGTEPEGLSAGAVAGIVIGVIACIVIIIVVILYLVKPECCPCFATAGLKSSGSGKKPAGSAVGSSNGSEKDKINQPVAAQRSQAPIQHMASNPGQELYALPERKQPAGGRGGDAPDRGSGPGQNEPQGMLYADLDLSSKAGHTEKHIPKNENDVVVYSSILV